MTALIEHIAPQSGTHDFMPALFSALADEREAWLSRVFSGTADVAPVLMACQQMAGHVNVLEPPSACTTEFRVVRIGDETFDVEGRIFGGGDGVLARATSVIALTDLTTSRPAQVPQWLARVLRKKAQHG